MRDITIERIERGFQTMTSWEDRYRFLIQLGRKLEPFPEDRKEEATRVRGCTSNVWLIAEPSENDPTRLHFRADSDAHIVKGLVALLLVLFSDRTPEEILATDAPAVLDRLELRAHLSPSRSNGLLAMVERIRSEAVAAAARG
jgi:cysteine desulfuration protein SufE